MLDCRRGVTLIDVIETMTGEHEWYKLESLTSADSSTITRFTTLIPHEQLRTFTLILHWMNLRRGFRHDINV